MAQATDSADRVDAGVEHALGIYDTDAFMVQAVVEFVVPALERDAMAVTVLPIEHEQWVRRELDVAGIDMEEALLHGDYIPVDSDAVGRALTAGGGIDALSYRAVADDLRGAAARRGCELRICGAMHSVLWEADELEALLELEELWNRLPGRSPVRLLCLYASRLFRDGDGDDPFLALCARHRSVTPVEDFASLVARAGPRRPVALLEQQRRASQLDRDELTRRRRRLEAELDACARRAVRRQGEFEHAVATRDVIGQAKGILMVRWRIDADTAFEMLRDASTRSHRKLRDVAAAVVAQQLRRL